jgi:hypothetical protein
MIKVMPVGSDAMSSCQTPLMPKSQVEKMNKPTNTSHSNQRGSTFQWGLLFLRREKKDFKSGRLSK